RSTKMCSFFFSSRRRHTRSKRDWSSDVCSSDLITSMVSFSSIFAVIFATILSLFYQDLGLTIATVLVLILVVVRHKDNIKRIRQGTESKVPFGLNKAKKK